MKTKAKDQIGDLVAELTKEFGKGTAMRLDGKESMPNVERVKTGFPSLDYALGGGMPRGRVIELYGVESGGKTTLSLQAMARFQAAGDIAAIVDVEHALDPEYAQALGVDVKNLIVAQPNSGDEALEITRRIVQSNKAGIVVVDSVAALVPKAELEGSIGDARMGGQARLMSQAMRMLTAAISKTKTTVIFINQVREKIGISYGNPEVTSGGRALKFYSSVRIEVRGGQQLGEDGKKKTFGDKSKGDACGRLSRIKIVKNKVGVPFRGTELELTFGKGFSRAADVINSGLLTGVLAGRRSVCIAETGEVIGKSRQDASLFLRKNGKILRSLSANIYEALVAGKKVAEEKEIEENA